MQEIVTESEEFSLEAFVPMLRERMYARNAAARQFCVSWLGVLDAAPELPLARHLPALLDALLCMLDDPHPEIRRMSVPRPTPTTAARRLASLISHVRNRN